MAAPLGNKFAYGNPHSGRPCTWTKEIIEQEAELFIEWAQRDDALVLRKFAGLRGYSHDYLYQWKESNEVFNRAFKFVQTVVGSRREEYALEKCIHRDLPMYFDQLHKFERDEETFRASLKEKKEEDLSDKEKDIHKDFKETFAQLRSKHASKETKEQDSHTESQESS